MSPASLGGIGMIYNPFAGVYLSTWKPTRSDAGTWGTVSLNLKDGSSHAALFRLR